MYLKLVEPTVTHAVSMLPVLSTNAQNVRMDMYLVRMARIAKVIVLIFVFEMFLS